jgi:hypothetical protein
MEWVLFRDHFGSTWLAFRAARFQVIGAFLLQSRETCRKIDRYMDCRDIVYPDEKAARIYTYYLELL